MSEWRPIETAPKDATKILLYYRDRILGQHLMGIGHWQLGPVDETYPCRNWIWNYVCPPSHWMPLPEPPKDL